MNDVLQTLIENAPMLVAVLLALLVIYKAGERARTPARLLTPPPQATRRNGCPSMTMARLVIFLLGSMLLAGCGQNADDHNAKVAEMRAALPRVFHVSEYSHSMIPVIRPDDLIICNPFPWEKLEGGMDVLYWPVGSSVPVCHRLRIKIAQGLWEAHGINNPVNDPCYVSKENYLGVVVKQ